MLVMTKMQHHNNPHNKKKQCAISDYYIHNLVDHSLIMSDLLHDLICHANLPAAKNKFRLPDAAELDTDTAAKQDSFNDRGHSSLVPDGT